MKKTFIKALRWGKDKRISFGHALYLNLRKSSKTYIIRKRHMGKTQMITLENSPTLSLKEAKYEAMILSMEKKLLGSTVAELIEKYYYEFVVISSKVPNQVKGYLNHMNDEFDHKKIIDISKVILVRFIQKYSNDMILPIVKTTFTKN